MAFDKSRSNYIKINRARIKGREEASSIYSEEINSLKAELKSRVASDTSDFFISVRKSVEGASKRERELSQSYIESLSKKEIEFQKTLREVESHNNILLESLKKSLKAKEDEYSKKIEIMNYIIKENEDLNLKLKSMINEFSLSVSSRDTKISAALKQLAVIINEDKDSLSHALGKYVKLDSSLNKARQLTVN